MADSGRKCRPFLDWLLSIALLSRVARNSCTEDIISASPLQDIIIFDQSGSIVSLDCSQFWQSGRLSSFAFMATVKPGSRQFILSKFGKRERDQTPCIYR
jgi:hypothetical protein